MGTRGLLYLGRGESRNHGEMLADVLDVGAGRVEPDASVDDAELLFGPDAVRGLGAGELLVEGIEHEFRLVVY